LLWFALLDFRLPTGLWYLCRRYFEWQLLTC
jgi:hypothetical protein